MVKGLFYYFQNKWFIKTVIAAAPYLIAVILSLTPLQKYFVTDNRVNLCEQDAVKVLMVTNEKEIIRPMVMLTGKRQTE